MGNRSRLKAIVIIVLMVALMAILVGDSAGSGIWMDQDLKDSSASFIGEDDGDHAGLSVAGAGDVNGDGYDDILIGARYDSDGGTDVGQTYLILGKKSGWSMDTDLSKADASFIGEATADASGWSIAGAGDVNDDGFDDILIGAWSNGEGGYWAGQTYLILGKASGWAMDVNLTNADASFWGEAANDSSGQSIAGAGDVNGDGFDDILIGAYGNDEGGNLAGQTYLILGKTSGWSMDTNLSDADASFIGEDAIDSSGYSVAGAGDVDGDGFDDILIGAMGDEDGGLQAGQTYLILGKASGWAMDTDLSIADASFWGEDASDLSSHSLGGIGDVNGDGFDDILIGAPGDEDGGLQAGQTYLIFGNASGWAMDTDLSMADASFIGEDPRDQSGSPVAGAGDVNGDGYDDILISAMGNGEGGDIAGQTYLILGKVSGWAMDTDLSNVDASFWGENARDVSGFSVSGAGDVNGDGYNDILIGSHANDEGGTDAGQTFLIFYHDGAPPEIVVDSTPSTATTGDLFTFNITASDNHIVFGVDIEYWYGDSQFHHNVTTSHSSGDPKNGTWLGSIPIPVFSTETLHYHIHVLDRTYQVTSVIQKDVQVLDNDPPALFDDSTTFMATTGEELTFSIGASDNIGLSDVRVEYWYGDTGTHKNESMTLQTWDKWTFSITVPSDSLDTLHYFFYAEDNSTNHITRRTVDLDVVDNDLPVIGTDSTADTATTGETLTFSFEVWDNIGIEGVVVIGQYGDGTSGALSLSHAGGNLWESTITIEHTLEDMFYLIRVRDTSGNVNETAVRTIDIIDNDLPEIVEDLSDTTATTGEVFHARIRVRDNIGIDIVSSGKELWTGTDIDDQGNGVYEQEIRMDDGYAGPFYLQARLLDRAGNELEYMVVTPEVVDNDPPELRPYFMSDRAMKGGTLIFHLEVLENVDIGNTLVYVEYRFGQGPLQNESMIRAVGMFNDIDCKFYLDVPREAEGPITYRFTAVDAAGNWNSTDERQVILYNLPPAISVIPTWSITEELEAMLDLEPHLSDGNDEITSLTLECDDVTVTVDGLVLRALYDEAVADWTIRLTVSDGEDDAVIDVVVHIVNVNDDPSIDSISPEDGSKYKEGKIVTFTVEATDEDGDDLTVTWTSDGVTIGTGDTLDYKKLKPGARTIKVTVSDGEASVDDEFTVVITKEEESPALGGVFALLAMLVGVAASMMRRKGESDCLD